MFGKRCSKCSKKVSRSFDFCPYCGIPINNPKDYGLLGKNDDIDELRSSLTGFSLPKMNMGGLDFNSNLMEKMLGNAFKMLEKEMRNINQEENIERTAPSIPTKTNFQLFINGKKVNLPEFKNHIQGNNNSQEKIKEQQKKLPEISAEILKKSAKLPRKEAKSKVQRFKDKLIYELDTPGLESVGNVLINKLEGAIEIKAYTDKAVFFKTLPVKLPLAKYAISPEEGKLFLEFKA